MNNTLLKKCIAEAIGTFVLVFVACGVAAITNGNLVPTALAFGLVIVAMAYSIGNISGCHINPAVSLGCFLTKRMTGKEFGFYVLSQVIGGLLGGVLLFGILKMSGVDFKYIGDACNYAVNYEDKLSFGKVMAALLIEIVLTFIFVYVILNVTDEKHGVTKMAGLIIGLTLTLVHLLGIYLTGTSVNPARSLATALCTAMYNGKGEALKQLWMFIVGPMAGGALAAVVYPLLHKENKEAAEAQPTVEATETKED